MKKRILVGVIISCLLLNFSVVYAAENNGNGNNNDKSTLRERIQERWNQRCEVLETRIDLRMTRYDNNRERHTAIYQRMQEKMEKFMERLETAGYDVSQLNSDLSSWQEQIETFRTDYGVYIENLENTKNYSCGESEGKFVQALAESRSALRTVHQDVQNIRLYYEQTIRKDLQSLKSQEVNTVGEDSEEEDNS